MSRALETMHLLGPTKGLGTAWATLCSTAPLERGLVLPQQRAVASNVINMGWAGIGPGNMMPHTPPWPRCQFCYAQFAILRPPI
jgi:hypothetical protein